MYSFTQYFYLINPFCLGTTRNNFEGKKVIHLEYEAYASMAETEIKKICRNVRQKWPSVKHIAVHHRLGYVCPDPVLLHQCLSGAWLCLRSCRTCRNV